MSWFEKRVHYKGRSIAVNHYLAYLKRHPGKINYEITKQIDSPYVRELEKAIQYRKNLVEYEEGPARVIYRKGKKEYKLL